MKYQSMFDIWNVPVGLYKFIQPGQWVYAGDKGNTGRFMGVKRSGTVVVAWQGNTDSKPDKREYLKFMREYAKG